jgi:hypothetical protein
MLSDYQVAMVEHLLATAAKLPPRHPLMSNGEFLRLMSESDDDPSQSPSAAISIREASILPARRRRRLTPLAS